MKYCLAIDIGASSGRHILGWIENGKIFIEEIYRFENSPVNANGALVWNVENLIVQVKAGIRKCKEIGKIPDTVAIDTWGVDYVLLDENKKLISPAYSYRDSRTLGVDKEVESLIGFEELYKKTGIQKLSFNTLYQLYCDKKSARLGRAKYFLMIPAYISYLLTGEIKNEYTNATTTGMVNANERCFDVDICQKLGINPNIFGELLIPGSEIGEFSQEVQQEAGFNARVLFCPSHDTASAVAACPIMKNDIYISSGTWSLIGTEIREPILTDDARIANFTNEGGIEYRFRLLKNYMGMWLLQNIRKNLNKSMSYDEMMRLAENCSTHYYIDINAKEFLAPDNMIEAIKNYLGKQDMSTAEVINTVYHSLARSYKYAVEEVERISGIKAAAIHIVGGGSKDAYLNRLTAEYTGKRVFAGPVETTALGNIVSQLISQNKEYNLDNLRNIISKSFDIVEVSK